MNFCNNYSKFKHRYLDIQKVMTNEKKLNPKDDLLVYVYIQKLEFIIYYHMMSYLP